MNLGRWTTTCRSRTASCQAIEPLPVDDATYAERQRLRRWPWRSGSDGETQTGVSKGVAVFVTGF